MTEHKDIQNPDDYTDKDYQKWEYLLLDPDTSKAELEDIVMTLAHLPTEKAKELLKKFKQSDRADEVCWLEPALEENEMWLLNPDTDQKTRDMKAMKLSAKKQKIIVELMGKCDVSQYSIDLMNIEIDALNQMEKEEKDEEFRKEIGYRKSALNDMIIWEQSHLEEAKDEIAMEEKISEKIEENVKTEAYKQMDFSGPDGWHFDGEEW